MNAAQKSMDVQYYIWHEDLTGKVMHNRLLAAADRGVRVRLLLDDLDTAGKEETLRYIDAHPNIEVRVFNPFPSRNSRAGGFVSDFGRLNHRMHNKTITMDNQITIFGGRNIGDEYFDAAEEVGFSDMDAIGIGPVVNEISESFDLYWNSQWAYPLAAFKTELPINDETIALFREESNDFLIEASKTGYANAIRGIQSAQTHSTQSLGFQWGDWILVYDQPSKVEAKDIDISTHLAPKLKLAMDKAENEILIISPYFVPGKKFTEYLVGRVKSGVKISVLTNSLAANDVAVVFAGYKKYRKDLLKGGVELYEVKATKEFIEAQEGENSKNGAWKGSSRSSLHAKFFAFDQKHVFIGSFNLDGRSVAINTELGVYFESPLYAKKSTRDLKRVFPARRIKWC
ncbi:MAG: phospholipase D family protein [Pseudomonadales bacterium]